MNRFLARALILSLTPFALHATPIRADTARGYLTRFEGYRTVAYRDGSQWCVGIGHALPGQPPKRVYSHVECTRFFAADLDLARSACRRYIRGFDLLPYDAQVVSISLYWTTGSTGFSRFTRYHHALSTRHYQLAAHALRDSIWWRQVGRERSLDAYARLVSLR